MFYMSFRRNPNSMKDWMSGFLRNDKCHSKITYFLKQGQLLRKLVMKLGRTSADQQFL